MKIKSINIKDIGCIANLHIDFNNNMNIICGPNGIGKTTILECIAHSFSADQNEILKRNALSDNGVVDSIIEIEGKNIECNIKISSFIPGKGRYDKQGLYEYAKNLLSLKVTRTFEYQPLDAVRKDRLANIANMFAEAKSGIKINDVKTWFLNRLIYSSSPNSLTEEQFYNLELAKKSFSLFNSDFIYSRVIGSSNEIMLKTPYGEIYYEYLSSGFKSCVSIIIGIIKEIEIRFKEPCIKADEFEGIILIDELEIHLHPEWQSKIASVLVKIFPKAQFITTTHSPHVLQNAKVSEIIALASTNGQIYPSTNGQIYQRELDGGDYGFQGWTVEEILLDVMGMSDTRTEIYKETISTFDKAIEQEDYNVAKQTFDKLDELLHPNNHLRKLLRFDLASINPNQEK
jgi:predicted ATP-binding protein involved in virulence